MAKGKGKVKLKPVVKTVTSTSGKKFKRTYYEKAGDSGRLKAKEKPGPKPKEKDGPPSSDNKTVTPELKEKFESVRKRSIATMGNTLAVVVSKHNKGTLFNPSGNGIHNIPLGKAMHEKDFKNLRVFGIRRDRAGKGSEIVFREGHDVNVFKADGTVYNKVQNDLVKKTIPKIEAFMDKNGASLMQLSSMIADKHGLSSKSVHTILNSVVNGKKVPDGGESITDMITSATGLKSAKRIDNVLMATVKHFNKKSDILKTINKYTKDIQDVAEVSKKDKPKKIRDRVRRFQVTPSIARIKSEVEDEITND